MGYTTYFNGILEFNRPVDDWLADYIKKFSKTRRMRRDNNKIKELFPNWKELCFNGELGDEGEYFVGGTGFAGQDHDSSILDYNRPALNQPGLWCDWVIGGNNDVLEWNETEKFYYYEDWLNYLIKHFFAPLGYILNGDIHWEGEDSSDFGTIHVVDNVVKMQYGIKINSMNDISTEDLIAELESRGYTVAK